jgi:sec-independent protein translocase protein TatB
MFGMSGTGLVIILVLALLLLGPEKLPEVAKLLGKGMREFQKATDDLKSTVETEFHKMSDDIERPDQPRIAPPRPAVAPVPASPVVAVVPSPESAVAVAPVATAVESDADLSAKVVNLESWSSSKSEGSRKS